MVFQDPYGSLDPRQTVARIVAEPLPDLGRRTTAALREQEPPRCWPPRRPARRRPRRRMPAAASSGGQRQPVAIAGPRRARPRLIVADEPVSALDVSVQAPVLDLMQDLAQQFGVTYLLIEGHDLAVVDHPLRRGGRWSTRAA